MYIPSYLATYLHTYIRTHTHSHIHTHKQSYEQMEEAINTSDVILVSGGNTLFAVDRWKRLQLDRLLHIAMCNGKVLTGGSAGAICVFDGGHSDSADPDTYKDTMLDFVKVCICVYICVYVSLFFC
jgi:peptidase E